MLNRKYVIILIALLTTAISFAQVTLKGKVTDNTGEGLFGVTLVLQGTTQGVTTDFDGLYQFTVQIPADAILVVSYLGMKTQSVPVNGRKEINIVLEESSEKLEEIVIVGYGSQVKKDITGSVSTIKAESLESRANNQIGSLIQGQSAGVQVISSSGEPSAPFSIRIRGTNSIQSSSDPLYVVDGVPTTNTRAINPQDIESLTILKDASSAAIYGAQAANGVVLITTKRGKTGKPQVTLDVYSGFSQVWRTLPVLNGEQYRDLMTEMGLTTTWSNFTARTDWQNEIFQNGLSQNYQVAVSGKTEGTNYYVSAGYTSQTGAIRSAELERTNFKINIDQEINDWLKLGTRMAYTDYYDVDVNDNNNVNAGGVLLGALTTPSIIGVFNDDGMFASNPFQNWENPLASTDGLDRGYKEERFIGNVYLEATFLENFKYKINYGIDRSSGIFDSFLDPFRTAFGNAISGQSINRTNTNNFFILDNTITYKYEANEKHVFDALVGSVIQKTTRDESAIETRNFSSDVVSTPNEGAIIQLAEAFKIERTNVSFMARVNYSFDDKYLLTSNIRIDGSSNFGPENRWGYFPSFSAGWRVSKESFFKNIKTINDLKIRLGWGIVGNDQIGEYAFLGRVRNSAYPIGNEPQPASFPFTLGNPELKWEESEQLNVGIDMSLLDSKINLTLDAYVKNTRDLLLDVNLPTTSGFSSVISNIGTLQNRGVEFSVQTTNVNNETLQWNSSFNISVNRNEVKSLNVPPITSGGIPGGRGDASLVQEGLPLGTIVGYRFGGVDPQTGNAFYIDRNGVSTFNPTEDDITTIGDANPDFIYGFSNTINYKDFGLTFLLEGSYGGEMLNATRIEMEGMSDPKNQSTTVLQRWRQPGDITNIPRASFGNVNNSRISTRFIEDASYLRVKAITFSYQMPQKLTDSLGLSSVKLYATGENLFTFTNYTGLDPEVNAFGGSNTTRGIDFGTYPQTRNMIFGLNVIF